MFELLLCSELGSSAPALSNGEDSGCFPAGPAPQKHLSHSPGPGGVGMLCCKVPWGAGINLGGKISLLLPQLWGLSLLPVDPAGDAAAPLRNMESEKLPKTPQYPGSRPRQAQQSCPPAHIPSFKSQAGLEVHSPPLPRECVPCLALCHTRSCSPALPPPVPRQPMHYLPPSSCMPNYSFPSWALSLAL